MLDPFPATRHQHRRPRKAALRRTGERDQARGRGRSGAQRRRAAACCCATPARNPKPACSSKAATPPRWRSGPKRRIAEGDRSKQARSVRAVRAGGRLRAGSVSPGAIGRPTGSAIWDQSSRARTFPTPTWPSQKATLAFCECRKWPLG